MSATIENAALDASATQTTMASNGMVKGEKPANNKNYKGFVAGVFSGIAKLSGKYSFVVP